MKGGSFAAVALTCLISCAAVAAPTASLSTAYGRAHGRIAATKSSFRSRSRQRERVNYGSIEIWGTPRFIQMTKQALDYLAEAQVLERIQRYIKMIYEPDDDMGSGMYVMPKAFRVGGPTWKAGPVWYAGAIAHDSMHSKLFWDAWARGANETGVAPDVYTGPAAERKCLAFQFSILADLGYASYYAQYFKRLESDPSYADAVVRDW